MINFNGTILKNPIQLSVYNRGYSYGDSLFETIRTSYGKILFWEDHYFRLMASMRIMRMEIPMSFTMEFLENEIVNTLKANQLSNNSARVKLSVFRNDGGLYLPESNGVGYLVTTNSIDNDFYSIDENQYEVDLFKDFFLPPGLLSTLKTNNKALNVIGSIYAKENSLNNCLLLNTNKHVVEALNGNIFVVKKNIIKTPPILDGCLKGVMRKQIIEIINELQDYEFIEESVSPFELQQADEIFITNVITGVKPISKYRKKIFQNDISRIILQKLNIKIRLN